MGSLSRILLPVDFSERSVAAVRYARSLAAYFGSELLLLHVLTPPQYEFGALQIGGSMIEELYRGRAQQAAVGAGCFPGRGDGRRERRARRGGRRSRRKNRGVRHERNVDIIMMPTHGFGPYRRFILGSNTAKVLHDAECPVWTCAHIEQVSAAAAVPLTRHSVRRRPGLGELQDPVLGGRAGAAIRRAPDAVPRHLRRRRHRRRFGSELAHRCPGGRRTGVVRLRGFVHAEADLLIEAGEPAKAICAAAAPGQADALVIGRGSAAGLFGRLRTNAYAIIRQAPCPVVSV